MPDGTVKSKSKSLETNLKFKYMPGFGNDFETEALPNALPPVSYTHLTLPTKRIV